MYYFQIIRQNKAKINFHLYGNGKDKAQKNLTQMSPNISDHNKWQVGQKSTVINNRQDFKLQININNEYMLKY